VFFTQSKNTGNPAEQGGSVKNLLILWKVREKLGEFSNYLLRCLKVCNNIISFAFSQSVLLLKK